MLPTKLTPHQVLCLKELVARYRKFTPNFAARRTYLERNLLVVEDHHEQIVLRLQWHTYTLQWEIVEEKVFRL